MSLRKKLAEFGFESNDDYDYALRCLFEAQLPHLRCLNIVGSSGRRKTALANALGHALDYPHILYHDFTDAEPPPPPIVLGEDATTSGALEAPLTAFERSISEACAYSEGARTLLILDQLQAADFHDHIRLYHFVQNLEWISPHGAAVANPQHLLLMLISEEPLYHSLAKVSFRIHADASRGYLEYRPKTSASMLPPANSWPHSAPCSMPSATARRPVNTRASSPTSISACVPRNNCASRCSAGWKTSTAPRCTRRRCTR